MFLTAWIHPLVIKEMFEVLLLSWKHCAKSCGEFNGKHAGRELHSELYFWDNLEQKAIEKFAVQ